MGGTRGGGGVIYTARSCPACEGMGAGGPELEWGEDEEVGRVACAVRRIAKLGSLLGEAWAGEEWRRGLVGGGRTG